MKKIASTRQKGEILVHDYKTIIDNIYKQIESELSQNNVEIIKKYDRMLVNESLADATRSKNLSTLLSLSRVLKMNWVETAKEDIEELVFNINKKFSQHGQETNTTVDHKKILKRFYRWLKYGSRDFTEVGDPPETKWIKTKRVKDGIVREELISEDEHERLLKACGENLRDRAFIHCHMEAGTRPGEILNLRIKHVKFDQYGAVLHVDGKTGPRVIRLIKSTPDLANYLSKHPDKENPDAPLWIMLGHKNYGMPLTYAAARKTVQRIVEKSNLEKRVYLNLFRHSEATITANFLTEAQTRIRHGWSSSSKMPSRYVHLVDGDVDKALFEHYGITKEEKFEQKIPKTCSICNLSNPYDTKLCTRCGRALDLQTALEVDERERTEKDAIKNEIVQMKSHFTKQLEEIKYGFESRESFFNNLVLEAKRDHNRAHVVVARIFQMFFELAGDEKSKIMKLKKFLEDKDLGNTIGSELFESSPDIPENNELLEKLLATKRDFQVS
ncbi:MAG: tyrosine-type recombinase/integrase [Nitrosopumilaceae archaeon]